MPESGTLAQRLLDAHVEFTVAELTGPQFAQRAEALIDKVLTVADALTLADMVQRDTIKAVARRYAVEMDIAAAIPEIAGDAARLIVEHPINETTTVADIINRADAEAWLAKAAEFHEVRVQAFAFLERNDQVREFVTDAIQDLIADFLRENRERVGKIPGLGTALGVGGTVAGLGGAVAGKMSRGLIDPGKELDQRIRGFAEQGAHTALRRAGGVGANDDLPFVEIGLDLYDEMADRTIASLQEYANVEDVEDFIVMVYEFWRSFRGSRQFAAMLDAGVDLFFDHYGEHSLAALLSEFGVSRDDLVAEAMRFAPSILATLAERGILQDLVRDQLAAFYDSAAAQSLLGAGH